ncbi:MAG: TetR/AcrR family transcriptional regulator [Melioribacteraceae bacterium]|nr:TetR/AcrR family transcriptional regulator [Melioribacteraceae bacterium]
MAKSINTRAEILDVALNLFSEKSYHGASIRDIAKEIGKRESSIYNHFSSKEDILNELIEKFSSRNFGKIVLTDDLVNIISKPEKFFKMLAENILDFWDSKNERMFIKILIDRNSVKSLSHDYNLSTYLNDFRNLLEFILTEMIKHKFIGKFNVNILSNEFISPLFLLQLELILGYGNKVKQTQVIKDHVEYFWKAIKR